VSPQIVKIYAPPVRIQIFAHTALSWCWMEWICRVVISTTDCTTFRLRDWDGMFLSSSKGQTTELTSPRGSWSRWAYRGTIHTVDLADLVSPSGASGRWAVGVRTDQAH